MKSNSDKPEKFPEKFGAYDMEIYKSHRLLVPLGIDTPSEEQAAKSEELLRNDREQANKILYNLMASQVSYITQGISITSETQL